MNLFDADLRAQITQIHKNIFDSWKRGQKIRFYKKAKEVFVEDSNYNGDLDEFQNNNNLKITESAEFDVCLTYLDRQILDNFIGGEDSNVRFAARYNRIKIQVELDAFEYLKETERFTFGEDKYRMEDTWRKLGMLDEFQFYEVILQRVT